MKVIYDGECSVCASLKNFAEDKDTQARIMFVPYQADNIGEVAPGLTAEETRQALYTISQQGKRTRGARAVFEVMKNLPGIWGIAGRLLSIAPFVWFAEPVYRIFAKHRNKLSNLI